MVQDLRIDKDNEEKKLSGEYGKKKNG